MKLHKLPVLASPFDAHASTQRGDGIAAPPTGEPEREAVKFCPWTEQSQIPVPVPSQPYLPVLRHNALCYIKALQAQALLRTHLMLSEANYAHLSCL